MGKRMEKKAEMEKNEKLMSKKELKMEMETVNYVRDLDKQIRAMTEENVDEKKIDEFMADWKASQVKLRGEEKVLADMEVYNNLRDVEIKREKRKIKRLTTGIKAIWFAVDPIGGAANLAIGKIMDRRDTDDLLNQIWAKAGVKIKG